jgi:hypothetical protein
MENTTGPRFFRDEMATSSREIVRAVGERLCRGKRNTWAVERHVVGSTALKHGRGVGGDRARDRNRGSVVEHEVAVDQQGYSSCRHDRKRMHRMLLCGLNARGSQKRRSFPIVVQTRCHNEACAGAVSKIKLEVDRAILREVHGHTAGGT